VNKNIKMIVTDLDGTLLKTDKSISENTKAVLNLCREVGIKIVYATGRGEGSTKQVVPEEIFDGIILNNGAFVTAADFIYSRFIPADKIQSLLNECTMRKLDTGVSLHGRETGKFWIENCTVEDSIFIKNLLTDELYFTIANDGLGMVMHKEATKAKAVSALAQHWDIFQAEIVAFGDDLNDMDMLSYAGVGVAMENAFDEVKAVSDFVCLRNDEDGVAKWLEENIL